MTDDLNNIYRVLQGFVDSQGNLINSKTVLDYLKGLGLSDGKLPDTLYPTDFKNKTPNNVKEANEQLPDRNLIDGDHLYDVKGVTNSEVQILRYLLNKSVPNLLVNTTTFSGWTTTDIPKDIVSDSEGIELPKKSIAISSNSSKNISSYKVPQLTDYGKEYTVSLWVGALNSTNGVPISSIYFFHPATGKVILASDFSVPTKYTRYSATFKPNLDTYNSNIASGNKLVGFGVEFKDGGGTITVASPMLAETSFVIPWNPSKDDSDLSKDIEVTRGDLDTVTSQLNSNINQKVQDINSSLVNYLKYLGDAPVNMASNNKIPNGIYTINPSVSYKNAPSESYLKLGGKSGYLLSFGTELLLSCQGSLYACTFNGSKYNSWVVYPSSLDLYGLELNLKSLINTKTNQLSTDLNQSISNVTLAKADKVSTYTKAEVDSLVLNTVNGAISTKVDKQDTGWRPMNILKKPNPVSSDSYLEYRVLNGICSIRGFITTINDITTGAVNELVSDTRLENIWTQQNFYFMPVYGDGCLKLRIDGDHLYFRQWNYHKKNYYEVSMTFL